MNMYISTNERMSIDHVNKVLSGVKGGAFKAVYNALKRAGRSARTEAGRYASAQYAITKSTFMENTRESITEKGGYEGVASVELRFAGYVLNLPQFDMSFTKGGKVSVKVMRDGKRTTFNRAFSANVFGHQGVYERVGRERFPLKENYGPSTAHMMDNPIVTAMMVEKVEQTYEKRIDHEILRLLNGWGE